MAAKKPISQKLKEAEIKHKKVLASEKKNPKSKKVIKEPKSILTLRPTPEEIKILNALKEATGLKTSSGALFRSAIWYVDEYPKLIKDRNNLTMELEEAQNFVTDLRDLLQQRESVNKQIDEMLKEKPKSKKKTITETPDEVTCLACDSTNVRYNKGKQEYTCQDCGAEFYQ